MLRQFRGVVSVEVAGYDSLEVWYFSVSVEVVSYGNLKVWSFSGDTLDYDS